MYMTLQVFSLHAITHWSDIGTSNDYVTCFNAYKQIAGVPRASLVVVAATCGMFDISIEGIVLYLAWLTIFWYVSEVQQMF
jgi:hypothetical protein